MAIRPQSSELTGGSGFTFEDGVSAQYLAGLLFEGSMPGLPGRIITRVALQQAAFGEPLDDLIVDGTANDGSVARLSLQIKRSLNIGAGTTDFREIIGNSWKTLKKDGFQIGRDRFGFVVGTISDDRLRSLQTICEWARASDDATHFAERFAAGGLASNDHRSIRQAIETILLETGGVSVPLEELQSLLAHFLVIKCDALHEGAASSVAIINQLTAALSDTDSDRGHDLWDALQQIAHEQSGRSAAFQRPNLLTALKGRFRFRGSNRLQRDLLLLESIAAEWSDDIGDRIGGVTITRPKIQTKLDRAIADHRFVQIQGAPGTGKSAVFRQFIERHRASGPVLFIKSDRLDGRSWQAFARSIGLECTDARVLLCEIGALGLACLCIDGIDRIEPAQRNVVTDLIRVILETPELADWRIVVTARDAGIEPLRNWLPSQLFASDGVGIVEVKEFDDDETQVLSEAVPSLSPLLYGSANVSAIARRPFFASVLVKELATPNSDSFAPRSEVDLIERWWLGGGYNASRGDARARQRAIVDLARAACLRLGRPFPFSTLKDSTVEAIEYLLADGILIEPAAGHSVNFAHDIFFEWACFHLLKDAEEDWISLIEQIGEPPVLGRVVELLSHAVLTADDGWRERFRQIEASNLRTQWARAWLLGPFSSPDFAKHREAFEQVVVADEFRLLQKLLVWFQAEKTKPNEIILAGNPDLQVASNQELIRIADLVGWPSDFMMWRLLLVWLFSKLDGLPLWLVPHIVPVFEVWQNAFSDIRNTISKRLVQRCANWLIDLEAVQHPPTFSTDLGAWEQVGRRDDLKSLSSSLRSVVLKAAPSYPDTTEAYLHRIIDTDRIRREVFEELMRFSPVLATTHPQLLADLTRAKIMEELPEDKRKRLERERAGQMKRIAEINAKPESERTRMDEMALTSGLFRFDSFSHHDWKDLSISDEHRVFYPPSPLREPFHSLFLHASDIALALVRDVTNHAITAWRQLHHLDHQRQGTPIPITLQFPWGEQVFWGDEHEYMWGRSWWGPQAIQSAMFALDAWAFSELEKGTPAETIIERLLNGHESLAPLAIATAVMTEGKCATAVTLPIAVNQRLWHLDLRRWVAESSNSRSSLIGYNGTRTERPHIDAVVKSSSRACRKIELRSMAVLFVLHHDEAIRNAARSAIQQFPDNLPYAYEEQRGDKNFTQGLKETAENWAEWGRIENYRTQQYPDEQNQRIIYLENPKSNEPEALDAAERHQKQMRELSLFNWVTETFEKSAIASAMTLADAVAIARSLDHPELFQQGQGNEPTGMCAGAVAGAAAAIFCFSNGSELPEREWGELVIERAFETPEASEGWFSGSIIPWHPQLFVARALAAKIRSEPGDSKSIEMLLTLTAHPLEKVSLEATRQLIACWDANKRLAWIGFDLAFRLCIGSRKRGVRSAYGYDPAHETDARAPIVAEVVRLYLDSSAWPELTTPPPAWELASRRRNRDPFDDEDESDFIQDDGEQVWRDPDRFWRWDMATEVLKIAPVDLIMADPELHPRLLTFADALLDWTLERINPSWKDDDAERRRNQRSELFEWRRQLSMTLAQISAHLPAEEIKHRYLERIFALDDEQCMSFLSGFVHLFLCIRVMDAKDVAADVIQILDATVERMLKERSFRRSGYRDGEVYGHDVPQLIRDLLFSGVPQANLAHRFANGDWREIGIMMPIIDKLVEKAGWIPFVATNYLSLCEQASKDYPAQRFADQVLSIFRHGKLPRSGWNDWSLPARIAGMVQTLADREHPLDPNLARKFLRILDFLVDMGDRRSAALQTSDSFRNVKLGKEDSI